MCLLGGAIVLAAVWIGITGWMARGQLSTVRAELSQLRTQIASGQLRSVDGAAAGLGKHAHRAHQLTTGPAWALAAALPAGGDPLKVMREVTAMADTLGNDNMRRLVTTSNRLDPSVLRRSDGSVNLPEIAAAVPLIDAASQDVRSATNAIAELPSHTWLPVVDAGRSHVLTQLTSLGHSLRSAELAARIVPEMLGAQATRRYFVAFQNEAEARGTGGLPGAFGILEAEQGKVRFTRFESDSGLGGVSADVDFGPAYNQLYDGAGTTTMYGNGNLSPHFPYAARIWTSMWQRASGQHLDGAIALDPTALSYLLAVAGPARLPDGTQVSARNIVELTQSRVYAQFPADQANNTARRQYLLEIARAASRRILDAHGDSAELVRAVAKAAGERRLLVWSTDSKIEAQIEQTSVSGAVPVTEAAYVGLSIVNDGGNKLDYYLDRELTWKRTGCGGTRAVSVAITLTNNAPPTGLSSYVTGRSDHHSYPVRPGDNRLEVSYLATHGALLRSVTIGGHPATSGIGLQQGHPLYTVDLELPRGASRTIVLNLSEPATVGAPLVLRQPLVRPLTVTIDDARCG